MSEPRPIPDASSPATSRAIARAERRVDKLAHISDMAVDMMEIVKTDPTPAAAESFGKLSRAARLTITLEEKLDGALQAWLAGEPRPVDIPRARAGKAGRTDDDDDTEIDDPFDRVRAGRRGVVRQLLVDVADREIPDPDEFDIFADALDERLLYDVAYADLDDKPLRDIVERLCADLKLMPDWKR